MAPPTTSRPPCPPGTSSSSSTTQPDSPRHSAPSASTTTSARPTARWSLPRPARWPTSPTSSSASPTAGSNPPGSPATNRRWTTCSSRSSTTTRSPAMRTLTDTWTMTKRSLRHTTRSVDTIITVVLMPIGILLLFNYVFGGALGTQTGTIDYIDYITPAAVVMTVASGIAYAAVRLSTDLQKGIISRFRTMPVAPSSVLSGQALSSTLSNLFSCALVIAVAVLIGFRPAGG